MKQLQFMILLIQERPAFVHVQTRETHEKHLNFMRGNKYVGCGFLHLLLVIRLGSAQVATVEQ